ncbi:hypothetical protein S40285_08405 [Stachybotrys chlorohalonatus IBT 40285]|uniref:Glutamate-1-semialdehyde 2,1-aminomutase n=1 Tax=Stachybotrys chlorohalonatus (strain IBT 40285) TaxID=1283841 RepID=A0A084R364_STAC4|nr:hypothetical protein S40285_08405 [Stachybotrys chlorohalonata IBT 40285]
MATEAPPNPNDGWVARLQDLHNKAVAAYIEANPASQQRHEEALEHMPGGNTRSVLHQDPFPLAFQSGQGCFVTSLDGDEYLDFVSEYSAALFGHSNPVIQKAMHDALDNGMNLGGPGRDEVELARLIKARFPKIKKLRFCNSGTEANTMALALATNITKRRKILAFENGYHGGWLTFGTKPLSSTIPHDFVLGRFNDIEYTEKLLGDDLAAILVEPMQGAAGARLAHKPFLQFLRDSATKHGALLIFDEVVTSRLHMNGLQGQYKIFPDITTLGKYLGGGASFGAFGGREDIMSILDPRNDNAMPHSGTYNNNVLTMAAGVAAAKLMTQEKIEKANVLGSKLRFGINAYMQGREHEVIYAIGHGSMTGIHFEGPQSALLKDALWFFMIGKGIYIGKRGFTAVNFVHEQEHIDRFHEAFKEFINTIFNTKTKPRSIWKLFD